MVYNYLFGAGISKLRLEVLHSSVIGDRWGKELWKATKKNVAFLCSYASQWVGRGGGWCPSNMMMMNHQMMVVKTKSLRRALRPQTLAGLGGQSAQLTDGVTQSVGVQLVPNLGQFDGRTSFTWPFPYCNSHSSHGLFNDKARLGFVRSY